MKYTIFLGLGFELIGLILVSVFLGTKIDKFYQLKGFSVVVLLVLTLVGWFIRLVYLLKKIDSNKQEK